MIQPYYKSPNRDFTLLEGDCTKLMPQFNFQFYGAFPNPLRCQRQ